MKILPKIFSRCLVLLILCSLVPTAYSASSPVGGGVTPWTQIPGPDTAIKGIRVNPGWGSNKVVYGIDVGLANMTEKAFAGFAVGGLNFNLGQSLIILGQLGAINYNRGKMYGFGVQMAVINLNEKEGNLYGAQLGMVNLGNNKIRGIQAGFYNEAEVVKGIQIGLYNSTRNLMGIQIGLINVSGSGGLPFAPILNIGF